MSIQTKMEEENREIVELENGVHRENKEGKGRCDLLQSKALLRISKRLELGAKKYSDRDWNKGKGIPENMLLDSAMRHLLQYMSIEETEDHLAACVTNLLQLMEQQEK